MPPGIVNRFKIARRLVTGRIGASLIAALFVLLLCGECYGIGETVNGNQIEPKVGLTRIEEDKNARRSKAVVVEDGNLVYTSLLFPAESCSKSFPEGLERQVEQALRSVELALQEAGTGLGGLVRLNVYVADTENLEEVKRVVSATLPAESSPVMTVLEAALGRSDAAISMDAVAVTSTAVPGVRPQRLPSASLAKVHPRSAHAAIKPSGGVVFISGRAAAGDIPEATNGTLAELQADLARVGLAWEDVVQVKIFLQPMTEMAAVADALASYLPEGILPPLVFVEWLQDSRPMEIEVVAAASSEAAASGAAVEYFGTNARFSRIVRVNEGKLVFIGGLEAVPGDPTGEVEKQFVELERLLGKTGSSHDHLVKATYYLADPAADARLSSIRPEVYPPTRAPAASKLFVRGVGSGLKSTFDMIAVRPVSRLE